MFRLGYLKKIMQLYINVIKWQHRQNLIYFIGIGDKYI